MLLLMQISANMLQGQVQHYPQVDCTWKYYLILSSPTLPVSYLYFHINFGYEEFLYKLGECYSSNVERSSTVTHTSKYNGRANVDNVPAPVSLLSIFVPDR